ncbi:MAG: hypothetical protein H7338_13300 [Candidatus Sericytochromatia bacterium]|nr:hypothetical protein [Candidatus Sericytochromatia bacterium]
MTHKASTSRPAGGATQAQFVGPAATVLRDRFKKHLALRFFLRMHMSLILLVTGVGGFVTNRLLLRMGMPSMALRFALAVLVAYGIFLLCVRLWLAYMRRVHRAASPTGVATDVIEGVSEAVWRSTGFDGATGADVARPVSETGNAAAGTFWEAGGGAPAGETGGAAAGEFWGTAGTAPDEASVHAAAVPFLASSTDSAGEAGGGGDWGVDLGDDSGIGLALIALALIASVVFGAGIYLLWEAPTILAEVAFQVVITWSIKRSAGRMDETLWLSAVAKGTAVPFLIVLFVATIVGWTVQVYYPGVQSLGDLLR